MNKPKQTCRHDRMRWGACYSCLNSGSTYDMTDQQRKDAAINKFKGRKTTAEWIAERLPQE